MIATPTALNVPLRTDEHGRVRVGDTRVLLELVIYAFKEGETAEGIVDMYSTLKLADVYAVIAYYLTHRAEVDTYVEKSKKEADRIEQEVRANYTPEQLALHARLRAMRDKNQQPES